MTAWLFDRLICNVRGSRLSRFVDEAPSWSCLPVKWQIRAVIFIFIFAAALLVSPIILIQYSSAEVLAMLLSLHVLWRPSDRAKVVSRAFTPLRHRLPSYSGTLVYASHILLVEEDAIHHLTLSLSKAAGAWKCHRAFIQLSMPSLKPFSPAPPNTHHVLLQTLLALNA